MAFFYTNLSMRIFRLILGMAFLLSLVFSCKKDFNVNADWKDITIVYGLLNQNDSVHYIKVTKAFLGEGNSLIYAQNPDSGNYPVGDIEVSMDEYNESNLLRTLVFDTTMIHNKLSGDSIFYYPDQLMYKVEARLNQLYTYKLKIKNLKTNKEITSQTTLINDFAIDRPGPPPEKASFITGNKFPLEWYPAKGGKRYQLLIRFHYLETKNNITEEKSIDWLIFNDQKVDYSPGAPVIKKSIPGESFYTFLKARLIADPTNISRVPRECEFIFTVASPDLNTYMEVTEPSTSIIQERPPFTNIVNGIGLFSSRYDNTKDRPIIIDLSDATKTELKTNPLTIGLNF